MKSWRLYLAELVGTAALLCTVIGSGIMAENLSAGNSAIALIANTLATVFALFVLIETLGPLSGAHFNPAVSLVMAYRKDLPRDRFIGYVIAQLLGAALGAWLAHAMFDIDIFQWSQKTRTGYGQWLAEAVATAGLLFVILRSPKGKGSNLVASYIGAAYWFTASTSFANPAAVFGRMMSNSFAGISPMDAPAFIGAELVGACVGLFLNSLLTAEQHKDHLKND
jgi:glycerol uptake facilitator-like aquaporin